jgi:hypothetical protein
MDTGVRRGLGLLAVALMCGVVALVTNDSAEAVTRAAAIWCGLIGLAFIAFGLLRRA